jgi:transcriptional regulator with XRE-family HTH domain
MSDAPGAWLRQQRQARGWPVPEMARHLREAAKAVGDTPPANAALFTMIRRWEHGAGVSERYRLHYSRALGIEPEQFGCDEPYQSQEAPSETTVTSLCPRR